MRVIFIMFTFFLSLGLAGQTAGRAYDTGMRPESYGKERPDASRIARMQTEQMKKDLSLAPELVKKIWAINLEYAERLEAQINDSPDMTAYDKALIEKIRQERVAALKAELTPGQWAKYESKEKEREEQRRLAPR